MTCRRYAAALIDLAASGSEPNAELRAHLLACPSCRAVLQRERDLFTSIDTSLRASASAEVPAAFVQRVRAVVNQQPTPTRVLFLRPRVVFAVAAATIILFSFAYSTRRANVTSEENSTTQRHQRPSNALPPKPTAPPLNPASPHVPSSIAETRRNHASTGDPRPSPSAQPDPEILVSNDQEILLARYVEQLRQRTSLPPLASVPAPAPDSDLSQTPALQFSPIQIAQLDVKPLEERQE
jgi:hypothetical protein